MPIGLSEEYMDRAESLYFYTDAAAAARLPLPRPKFAHKGNCGHALLVCGSEDMAGAAVLATGAALRSGCGLVTVHLPRSERVSVHANSPSAIVSGDPEPVFSRLPRDMGRYDAVGVGPGVGQAPALSRLWRLSCGPDCRP
ncbi:MAG: NAD(P)H-hydrate dehydratase [Alistipes sp.]